MNAVVSATKQWNLFFVAILGARILFEMQNLHLFNKQFNIYVCERYICSARAFVYY